MEGKQYIEQLFLVNPLANHPVQMLRTGGTIWIGAPWHITSTGVPTQDSLRATPFHVAVQTNFDQIAAEVTGVIAASTVRLGVYADDGRGLPGALLLDAGTINGNSATVQAIAINLNLSPGRYWLCAVSQGGAPTMRTNLSGSPPIGYGMPLSSGATFNPSAQPPAWGMAGQAGALPAVFVASNATPLAPIVGLRIA